MDTFENFIKHWDDLIEEWKESPETTIKKDKYLTKFSVDNKAKSKLYKGEIGDKEFEFYKYLPEAYLGDPRNCCAVILNLNPGFGISPTDDIKNHPDYKLQHHDFHKDNRNKYSVGALAFTPYLDINLIQDIENGDTDIKDVPGGLHWWRGKYDRNANIWYGGRVDYIKHLYKLYFDKETNILPFALEICPWHSHKFNLGYIITARMKNKDNDLVKYIRDNIINPAVQATANKKVLPFVICIGKAITELSKCLGLKEVVGFRWENGYRNGSGIDNWPKEDNRPLNRTYQLYEYKLNEETYYLLNTYAPGSNKTPGRDTFQLGVEKQIIDAIKTYILRMKL